VIPTPSHAWPLAYIGEAAPVEATGNNMLLNFSVPSQGIYKNEEVAGVIIPVSRKKDG